MNRFTRLALSLFFITLGSSCALLPAQRAPAAAAEKPEAKPVVKIVREVRERKPGAPFLVETFRCSLQPNPHLNVGIRVYSSLDGKETSLIYGPERMDSPPVANDSFLYNGVKVILAGAAEGRTLYTFSHPKITLQIEIPRDAAPTAALEASYSEEAGASDIRGFCGRVSTVTY